MEDNGLTGKDVERLNEHFYRGAPHLYFQRRLLGLLTTARTDAELERRLEQAHSLTEPLERALDDEAFFFPDDTTSGSAAAFVAAEGEVLLHHVGESLLRLFLAHMLPVRCPWVEIARLRNPGKFKDAVKQWILDADEQALNDRLAHAFLGNRAVVEQEIDADLVTRTLDNYGAHLRHHCRAVTQTPSLYNAAKHGFAVQAGFTELTVALDGEEPLNFKGPTLAHLKLRDQPTRGWDVSTKWTDPGEQLAFTYVAVRMMASLWSVARHRYSQADHADVFVTPGPTPKQIIKRREHPLSLLDTPAEAPPLSDPQAQALLRVVLHA